MTIPPPKKPIDWKKAKKLYLEKRLTYSGVARELGYSAKTVSRVLIAHDVPRHSISSAFSGKWGRELYGVFHNMRQSCTRPGYRLYRLYGARGVRPCREWQKFEPFYAWARKSGYRPGLNLALIDMNRNFSPGNCRWQTMSERVRRYLRRAPRKPLRPLTAFGETKGAVEWSRDPRCAVACSTLVLRLNQGYPPEHALTMPTWRRDRSVREKIQAGAQPRPKIDWPRAVALYVDKGFSCKEIARRLRANYYAILAGLKQRGVYERAPPSRNLARVGRRLARVWRKMLAKCASPQDDKFRYYGARGIRVCRAWSSLDAFHDWALESGYEPGLALTRLDLSKDFSPANCYWATLHEVATRTKKGVKMPRPRWTVTAFGETKGPTAWSRDPRCAVKLTELLRRLRGGESPRRAISRPPLVPREGVPLTFITAFGQTQGLLEWTRDRRCKVGPTGLRERILRGVPTEQAIMTKPFQLEPMHRKKKARKRHRRTMSARA